VADDSAHRQPGAWGDADGAVASVPAADLAAVWVPGETGSLEVAVIGVTALDGSTAFDDWGPPPFVPGNTALACGDAPGNRTDADPLSGQALACDRHGLSSTVGARQPYL
jgi:hypothetical protein